MFKKIINILAVGLFVIAILAFSLSRLEYEFKWSSLIEFRSKFFLGFIMTIVISFFSLIFSLLIGIVMALFNKSRILFLKYLSRFYVELVRGTPFLVQIYFFYFIIATAFGLNNKYVLGIIILSLFSGAYVTEIIRGGIESINKSQIETAKSLGFNQYQTYRFVIIPQVIKRILPSLAGQLSSLVKDSSLLSVIAVSEFTKVVLEVDSLNFRTFENLALLGIGYILITLPISLLSKKLEGRFHYEA
jgi:polar amino acid transport system permease protein